MIVRHLSSSLSSLPSRRGVVVVGNTATSTTTQCRPIKSRIITNTSSSRNPSSIATTTIKQRSKSTTATQNDASQSVPFYGLPRPPPDETASSTTTVFDRINLLLSNAVTAYRNPERADAIAAVGEITGVVALQQLLSSMQQHPTGQQILHDRPIVSKSTIPYEELITSAKDISYTDIMNQNPDIINTITFGQAYGSFLASHNFDPDERSDVKYIENSDLKYVIERYRQCHDYYHVVTGLPPTVLGELGLKWIELYQTGLPVTVLSVTVGSFRLSQVEQQILYEQYLPWARQLSYQIPYGTLLNIYYEKEFHTPLVEVRKKYNILPAPIITNTNI